MALNKTDNEPSDLTEWRESLLKAARREMENRMQFRVKPGFESGIAAGDVRAASGDIVELTAERGAQLANWVEPVKAGKASTITIEDFGNAVAETDAVDPPGAPPVLNASLSNAPHSGGKGRK